MFHRWSEKQINTNSLLGLSNMQMGTSIRDFSLRPSPLRGNPPIPETSNKTGFILEAIKIADPIS